MSSNIRHAALLIPALVLATGMASAQTGLKVTQVDPTSGSVTQQQVPTPNSTVSPKAPTSCISNGTGGCLYYRYWDALPQTSTNFSTVPAYLSTPPNPQVAVGPDDIITIVNRTIARYPNPNSVDNCKTAGQIGCAANPYLNAPTSQQFLDPWIGITDQNTMCPTTPRSNATCVIDNASIRYDQLQGRFVVLFTVTDVPAHLSNFYLVVSLAASFIQGTVNGTNYFTPPIAAIVGGTNTGGVNASWFRQIIPINVLLPFPVAAGPAPGGTSNGGPFCPGGGDPLSPPGQVAPFHATAPGTAVTGCSNYFPTGARFGLDNDNIILTAPVLDMTQAPEPADPVPGPGLPGGPYAGTRVVTVPKLYVYNALAASLNFTYASFNPLIPGAVNLADDTATGTLTGSNNNPVPAPGPAIVAGSPANPILPLFWEPDNLRGRALASFTSQVGGFNSTIAGVIAPIDYLVGTIITDVQSNNFGAGTGQPGLGIFPTFTPFFVQPVVFRCPNAALISGLSGVEFCGQPSSPVLPGGSQVADLAQLGVQFNGTQLPRTNVAPIALTSDAGLVGQSNAFDNTDERLRRLFVGDSRPAQVIFREGLLYIARTARLWDSTVNAINTSTVVYDILKQVGPNCNGVTGSLGFCISASGTITVNAAGTGVTWTGGTPASPFTAAWIQQPIMINGVFFTVTAVADATHLTINSSVFAAGLSAPFSFTFVNGNPFTANGFDIANPALVLETEWTNGQATGATLGQPIPCSATPIGYLASGVGFGIPNGCDPFQYGFYAPMYDTPANVISSGPTSPINLFPWLEKLFVGMTTGDTSNVSGTFPQTQPGMSHPSLWDYRPGDDAFDSILPYLDPYTGRPIGATNTPLTEVLACYPGFAGNAGNTGTALVLPANNTCPTVPLTIRGGASTDPNDGSLWVYGAFAKARFGSIPGPGQWGTSIANYALDFPATDPYNNDNAYFADVQPPNSTNPFPNAFFTWIQIAKNLGIAVSKGTTNVNCPTVNQPIIPPPPLGGTPTTPGPPLTCNLFGPTDLVTRGEMARWVVQGQMDLPQILTYLESTGGDPVINIHVATFADAAVGQAGVPDALTARAIEIMGRRGYTKGCATTADTTHTYCPGANVTRAQMAVFLIRAKMNNVFPTTLSGIPFFTSQGGAAYGDNFNLLLPATPYFSDVTTTTVNTAGAGSFGYIQKMRELRITNGRTATANCNVTLPCGTYDSDAFLTRQEIATFIVRAFFL